MNIIFYRYKSICEPDFIDSFRTLGLEVIEDKDGMNSALSVDQKISHLGELILENRPLFVFTVNYYPFIALLCEKLHVFYIAETVDCPVFEIFNTSVKSRFNRLFLFDKAQYDAIHNENPGGIFHLPLGAACTRLDNTLKDVHEYRYDISFVGSLYNEKDPFGKSRNIPLPLKKSIDDAINTQLSHEVYGQKYLEAIVTKDFIKAIKKLSPDFYPSDMSVFDISSYVALNDYLSPHATYIERVRILNLIAKSVPDKSLHLFTQSDTADLLSKISVHGGVNSLTEMPLVFRQSKINLNITTRSITSGLSQRIWDVLACRGFLIANYQPEIDLYFKDGVHLVTYKSYDELIEKIQYYLSHEGEREQIARNGYEEVKRNGSVNSRVIEIIKTVVGG